MASYPGYSGFLYDSADIAQQPLPTGSGFNVPNNMRFPATYVDAYPQHAHNFPRPQGARYQKQPFPKKQTNSQPMQCDLCSITCSSLMAYNDHLAGQKHRKAVVKAGLLQSTPVASSSAVAPAIPVPTTKAKDPNVIICEVCNVPCCGPEVYKQHLNGAKHNKKVKNNQSGSLLPLPVNKPVAAVNSKPQLTQESSGSVSDNANNGVYGDEHITTLTNEAGNVSAYHCKLCDCVLNDLQGRLSHLKGRRHNFNYKSQIDPSLQVNLTPRQNRFAERKEAQRIFREEHYRQMDAMAAQFFEPGLHHFQGQFMQPVPHRAWGRVRPPHNTRLGVEDRYINTKINEVRMPKNEVNRIFEMASSCEKAFKLVSDIIAEEDKPQQPVVESAVEMSETLESSVKTECSVKKETTVKSEESSNVPEVVKPSEPAPESVRTVRGVLRVGRLVTGVFLLGDNEFNLVVLVKDKPTWSLLERIAKHLIEQIALVSPDVAYSVQTYDDGCIRVICETEPKLTCIISVTSSTIRQLPADDAPEAEVNVIPDPVDMLPIEPCLEALAQVRRAKWFQVQCGGKFNVSSALQVLRSLCKHDARLAVLNEWAQELLVEKCAYYTFDRSPTEVLRVIFGCLASGLLTSDGPGLYDPCEKDPVDAVGELSPQQREDLTFAAQDALRLIAFFQLYKVLGVKKHKPQNRWANKKKRVASSTQDEAEAQEKRPKEDFISEELTEENPPENITEEVSTSADAPMV